MLGGFTYFEVLIGVIAIISLIIGLCKGFISQLFRLIGRLGSLVVAALLCGKLGVFLNSKLVFVAEKVGETFGLWIWYAASFVLIWLVLAIIIGAIGKALTRAVSIPGISAINKILGGVLAVGVIYLIVSAIIGLVSIIPNDSMEVVTNVKNWLNSQINDGTYMRFLAEHNWFGNWLVSLIQ